MFDKITSTDKFRRLTWVCALIWAIPGLMRRAAHKDEDQEARLYALANAILAVLFLFAGIGLGLLGIPGVSTSVLVLASIGMYLLAALLVEPDLGDAIREGRLFVLDERIPESMQAAALGVIIGTIVCKVATSVPILAGLLCRSSIL